MRGRLTEKTMQLTITGRNEVRCMLVVCSGLWSVFQMEIESVLYTHYFLVRVMLPSLEVADVKLLGLWDPE